MGVCGVGTPSKKREGNGPTRLVRKNKNQVIISVAYNGNEKSEFLLDKSQKLSDLLKEMNLNTDYEYDFYDSNETLINDKLNNNIENIFDIKINPINISIKKYSLQIPDNSYEYISQKTKVISTLTFNNPSLLGIFIYDINKKQMSSYEYPFSDYSQLQFINKFTAFCNVNGLLYISGGEKENEGVNNFININLEEIKENELKVNELKSLNLKRYWHSMLFIPEKYIFFVGGPNVREVEMYDIEKNEMIIDEKLNYERCEPSLILVNNKYIYCICGFQLNNNFVDTIEKCNLFKKKRNWEIVNYQIKAKEGNTTVSNLMVSFFGVSYINNDILLIGEKDNNQIINPNYLLKPNEKEIDVIEEYGFIDANSTRLFSEKFFIPFSTNESISLPFKSGEPKILILNNNNGNINEITLKETNKNYESDI